jgi:hypothetical protein
MYIAIKRVDGGVSIMVVGPPKPRTVLMPDPGDPESHRWVEVPVTPADIAAHIDYHIDAWKGVHVGEYVSHRELNGALPPNREFRDAWTDDQPGADIDVDMPRARAIHMGRIREARDVAIARLDIDWMRHVGQDNAQAAQATENARQVLRDIPQTFNLNTAPNPRDIPQTFNLNTAPNPTALSALWPPGLERPVLAQSRSG